MSDNSCAIKSIQRWYMNTLANPLGYSFFFSLTITKGVHKHDWPAHTQTCHPTNTRASSSIPTTILIREYVLRSYKVRKTQKNKPHRIWNRRINNLCTRHQPRPIHGLDSHHLRHHGKRLNTIHPQETTKLKTSAVNRKPTTLTRRKDNKYVPLFNQSKRPAGRHRHLR